MPRCSVVMPHYENNATLLACLRSFTTQQRTPPDEIVVVDDGSSEHPAPLLAGFSSPVPITLLQTQRAGQSGATNAGIQAAKGDIVLLTCADIIATPQLVEVHLQTHAQAAAQGGRWAVCGHIAYAPWIRMTPFMRFLSGPGPQFDFDNIENPDDLNPASMYAPNVSAERADLLAVGGFDPGFPYGFQDTDLGLRLAGIGVHFVYRAKARVLHDHPNTLSNFLRRNRQVGAYIPRMLSRYPDPTLRERCRNSIRELVPLLSKLPLLVQAASEVEEAMGARRHLNPAVQDKLFALYTQALGLAFVEGLIESGEEARRVLGFSSNEWAAALSAPDIDLSDAPLLAHGSLAAHQAAKAAALAPPTPC